MSADDVDDFGDFVPRAVEDVILEQLVRGVNRRDIALELGLELAVLNQHVAQIARMHQGTAGRPNERVAIIEASLDDITQRTYDCIQRDAETTAPLLVVLLGVLRLRVALTKGHGNG